VAVAEYSTARGAPLLIAFRLADHTNRYGWSWPSVELLVEETGYSKNTVLRALADLEELAELFVERAQNRRGNRYRLRLPGIPGSAAAEAADLASGTVPPVNRSEDRNGPTNPPERSHEPAGTVPPVHPNRMNHWNPSAAPPKGSVRTRGSDCDACGGSGWVDAPGRPGEVLPCSRPHR
jgi:hypothetical protein